ncbi:MAG: putative glucarate transporter [Labilithrix sp.]|nr:putative glucarate transporter [Labilithrix sp.]
MSSSLLADVRGKIRDTNIWVVYAAIVVLGIAYGTSISVLAVHLAVLGISKQAMGGLAATFALGIVVFSIPVGSIVARFGAKPSFAAALAGYTVCVSIFPLLGSLTSIGIARFFDGAFSVGVWVSAETALLARSDKENKGMVMGLYAIAVALGYVIGPLLASVIVAHWSTSAAFHVAGAFGAASVAVVMFLLDREDPGSAHHAHGGGAEADAPRMTARQILWRVKTSCFGTFAYGYFQASVVLFLPLFLIEERGIAPEKTIYTTAFFAAGMLSMCIFAGRLGDRHGHLLVMRVLASVGTVMVASFVLLPSFALMCAAVFVAGATLASISPVSLALQGVVTPRAELGRANGFYNAVYAVGMLMGPPVSGALSARWGGGVMLYHLAALWAAFVVFTTVFAADDPRRASALVRAGR